MATLEQLKDRLQAFEADAGGNKDRKKLEVALELCAALAALDMKRGVVQYADLAIDLEKDCVPALCFRAEALQAMAQQRPTAKAAAKANKACAAGLAACDTCVALEGLSGYRRRLERCQGALAAAPPPPPKVSLSRRARRERCESTGEPLFAAAPSRREDEDPLRVRPASLCMMLWWKKKGV